MYCDITVRNALKRQIEGRLNRLGYEVGKIYDINNFLMNNEEELTKLKDLEADYPGISVYEHSDETLKIILEIPDEILRQYQGEVEVNEDNYSVLSDENLRRLFERKRPEFEEFVKDTRLALEQMTKIKDVKKKIFENIPSAVMSRLLELRAKLEVINDWQGIVSGYVGFLIEARDIVEVTSQKMREIKSQDELAYPKMRELMDLINANRHVFSELDTFFRDYAPNNPLHKLVKEAQDFIKDADEAMISVARDFAADILGQEFQPKYEQMEAELNKYIAAQEKLRNGSEARNVVVDRNIQKAKDEFAKHAPSRERIHKTLTGEEGDTNFLDTYVRAGITNPDLVVSGLVAKVKEAYRGVNGLVQDFQNEVQDKHSQYLRDTNQNDSDPEKIFGKFIVEVPIEVFNEELGDIETITEVHILHDVAPEFYSKDSQYRANLRKLTHQIGKADEATAEVLRDQRTKLDREYKDWLRSVSSRQFTDEYYQVQKMLDEEVGGQTLRSRLEPYWAQLSDIKRKIRLQKNIPTSEDIEQLDAINQEMQTLRSTLNKDGVELEVAEKLQAYYARNNELHYWDVTDQKRQAFELQRADIENRFNKGQITQAEYDRWKQVNETTKFTPEYQSQIQTLFRQINTLADKIAELQGREIDKSAQEVWDELRGNVRPFRDNNNVVNGQWMTPDQLGNAKELEEQIEEIKRNSINYAGFTPEQQEQKKNLYSQVARLKLLRDDAINRKDQAEAKRLKDQMSEIFDQIKAIDNSVLSTPELKRLQELYKKYMKRLAELRETKRTKYYEQEFQKQFGMWLNDNSSVLPPREFRFQGNTYRILNSGLVEVNGIERSDIDIEGVWRMANLSGFYDSNWFQNNHIQRQHLEGDTLVMQWEPTYPWRYVEPTKKEHIKSREPSFNWSDKIVLDKYKNLQYEENNLGKPKVIGMPNQDYRNLNTIDKNYLDFLTKHYLDAQDVYTPNRRLGYRVPSVEREFSAYSVAKDVITGQAKTSGKQLRRKFVFNEQDRDTGLADTSNKQVNFIPVLFRGKIDADLVSRNLLDSLTQYKAQSIKYENLEKVLPLSQALEETLDRYPPKENRLNAMAKALGIERKILKRGANRRLDAVRQLTDMFFYNEWKIHEKVWGKSTKTLDTLLGWRSYFALAGTTFQQLANLGNGIYNQLIQATLKSTPSNFTYKQWRQAYKDLIWRYSTDIVNDMSKYGHKSYIGQMINLFDVFDGKYITTAGKELENKGLAKKLFNLDVFFLFKNAAEYTLNVTTFIAYARNYTVQRGDQKIPLIEAFEIVNGRLQPKEGVVFNDDIRNDVSNKVTRLNRDINGNYGKLDQAIVERYWVGRAVFWMKKFIAPMVASRYGATRYSYEENAIIEGYWRGAFNSLRRKDGLLRSILSDPRNFSEYWKTGSEKEKRAVERTIKEMALLQVLALMLSVLFDFDDEDPDRWKKLQKRGWFYQSAFAATYKLKGEAETFVFYAGIDELGRIRKNAFSEIVPMFDQTFKIIKDIEDPREWFEDGEFDPFVRYKRNYRNHEKGDAKIITDLGKLFGITHSKAAPIEAAKNIELSKLR